MTALEGGSFAIEAESGWAYDGVDPGTAAGTSATGGARYEPRALIGQGGMGQVVLAHDKVLGREVALKVARPDHPYAGRIAERLAHEARITAALEHPGIVAVHDAGCGPDGQPFYVMRLVRGEDLSELIAKSPTLDLRLKLVRSVLAAAEAIGFAHAQGVVHRDVKPANIRIGAHGSVHVMDWGLATRRDDPQGGVVGTGLYMSPEQLRGEPAGPPADVWSLGVVLLEMVLGKPPTNVESALARLVRSPREVPRELVAIIQRCLRQHPEQRYPDAVALAEDLANYLDGRRVRAFDYPLGLLVKRALRRWRVPLGATLLALVAVVVIVAERHGAVVTERDRANRGFGAALIARATSLFERGRIPESQVVAAHALELVPESPRALGLLMARQAPLTREESGPLPERCLIPRLAPDAASLLCLGDGRARLFSLDGAVPHLRWSIASEATSGQILAGRDEVVLAYGDDTHERRALATGAPRARREGWSSSSFAQTSEMPIGINVAGVVFADERGTHMLHPCGRRHSVFAVAPDEQRWAAVCPSGEIRQGTFERGPEAIAGHIEDPAVLSALAFADGGLLFGTTTGLVGRLEPGVPTGPSPLGAAWTRELPGHVLGLRLLAVPRLPDPVVAAILEGGEVRLLSHHGVELAGLPRGVASRGLELRSDGVIVTVGSAITLWRMPPEWSPHRVSFGVGISGIALEPDGDRIAVGLGDGRVVVVNRAGDPLASFAEHRDVPRTPAFETPDGTLLAAWSTWPDLYRFATDGALLGRIHGKAVQDLAVLQGPSGEEVVATTWTRAMLRIRASRGTAKDAADDVPGGDELVEEIPLGFAQRDLAVSADRRLAVVSAVALRRLALVPAGLPPRFVEPSSIPTAVTLNGDREVIFSSADRLVRLDLETGAESPWVELPTRVLDLAASSDGAWLAGGLEDGSLMIWDLETGQLRAELAAHRQRVVTVAFDGRAGLLVSASWDGDLRVWDLAPRRSATGLEAIHGLTLEELLGATR